MFARRVEDRLWMHKTRVRDPGKVNYPVQSLKDDVKSVKSFFFVLSSLFGNVAQVLDLQGEMGCMMRQLAYNS